MASVTGTAWPSAKSSVAVGKAHYAQTDARKFQNYVVNDAPAPGAPPVPSAAPAA